MLHVTTFRNAEPPTGRSATLFTSLRQLLALAIVLAGLGTTQQAMAQSGSITNDAISLDLTPSGSSLNSVTYAGSQNSSPYTGYAPLGKSNSTTPGAPQLGTYDLNGSASSSIILTATSLRGTIVTENTNVAVTRLQYRVYLQGTMDAMKPNYTNLTMTSSQTQVQSDLATFEGNSTGNTINLLTGLVSGGTYVLDVRFQADITKGSNLTTLTDMQSGDYFYANFYVTPPSTTPAGGTTTWQSTTANGGSTDWAIAANWSNGVPTRFSNAIIPPKSNSNIVYPILNSPTTVYEVKNITLQGNQSSSAAQLTINTATLHVYGDISQVAGGMAGNTTGTVGTADPLNNSTLELDGADQIINGNLVVSDIIIRGSGTKSVINQLTPANILVFRPDNVTNGVILQSAAQDVSSGSVNTVFDTTGNSYIQLIASSRISSVVGEAETNVSYIKGVTRADRQLTASAAFGTPTSTDFNTFGNIGLDIRANHSPGTIVVYRVVGDALTGPLSATAVPIKRQYRVQGDDNSNNSTFAGSRIDAVFHYLNSADELNGIQESNLTMFRTVTNGAPYQAVYGTLDQANRTVTRLVLNSLSNFTLTLGDRTNPLPVSLVAFAATRAGGNAQLNWTTATEENNKGFNVQVSTNGKDFRTLSFVGSKLVNSTQRLDYSYLDQEAHKSGIRYYRLEQVDQDGKTSYSPVRAVSFDAAVTTEIALLAYPNPFTEMITLTMDGAAASEGNAQLKVTDLSGRVVLDQRLPLTGNSLVVSSLGDLRGGIYLAKVTMPDGATKTVRIRKQ